MDWIKCSDRMPELFDFVLVTGKPGGTNEPQAIAIAQWTNEKWLGLYISYEDGDLPGAYQDIEYPVNKGKITHWMPLPKLIEE